MKSKIIFFVAGMLLSLLLVVIIWDIKHPYKISIHYEFEKSQRYIDFLDENNVMYINTIDHLKRHWVKPHLKESDLNMLNSKFEKLELRYE